MKYYIFIAENPIFYISKERTIYIYTTLYYAPEKKVTFQYGVCMSETILTIILNVQMYF